jgi:hypothetical protein
MRRGGQAFLRTVNIELEVIFVTVIVSSIFAFVTRLLLLRWSRADYVGLALGAFAVISMTAGALFRAIAWGRRNLATVDPLGIDFFIVLVIAFCTIATVAMLAWPVWTVLARAFLPRRTAVVLLEYQRSLSQSSPDLARQKMGVG